MQRSIVALLFLNLCSCSGLFYVPDGNMYFDPEESGFAKPEVVRFKSEDGTKLWGWYFPARKKTKGLIVQFHGNAENLTSHFLFLAWLTYEGYDLFIFDYRGYGQSEGKPSQEGTYLDGKAALEWARQRWKKNKRGKHLIAYGQSLGGAIAARSLCDLQHADDFTLLVQDSTFANYKRVAKGLLTQRWWTWPLSWLPWIVVSNEFGTSECLEKNKRPVLVIHDQRDRKVRYENGEEVYETVTAKKDFWKLDQGLHVGVFSEPNEKYRREFVKFLDGMVN